MTSNYILFLDLISKINEFNEKYKDPRFVANYLHSK